MTEKTISEWRKELKDIPFRDGEYHLCPICGGSGATQISTDRLERIRWCEVCWGKGTVNNE